MDDPQDVIDAIVKRRLFLAIIRARGILGHVPLSGSERTEYRDAHSACPACGHDDVEQTCGGAVMFRGDEDHNHATCPCGWKGIVHELVPA